MRILKGISALFILAGVLGSCKKQYEEQFTLVRDCTATYLRDGTIDLPVANPDNLSHLDSGQVIQVQYYFPKPKKVKLRYGDDCGVPHTFPRGEWVIVEEVQ